jgi:hypothetical protein
MEVAKRVIWLTVLSQPRQDDERETASFMATSIVPKRIVEEGGNHVDGVRYGQRQRDAGKQWRNKLAEGTAELLICSNKIKLSNAELARYDDM